MLVKTVVEFVFEQAGLGDELADHGDQGSDGCAHGVRDHRRCFQLVGLQHGLDLDGPFLDAALAPASPQRRGDLGP